MPGVLCPIDFSESSRGALRYGALIAAHTGWPLTLLTVNDPLLAQAADMSSGEGSLDADARAETERFLADTLTDGPDRQPAAIAVATGKPPTEILRQAASSGASLIVMSSRGATGLRKLFLGSTTERVLRETRVPVLVTPAADRGPATLDDVRKTVGRILVPVDLTDALEHHVQAARRLAETLDVPMLLVHIVEPVRAIVPGRAYAAHVDSERRDRAERRLQTLVEAMPAHPRAEALVVFGEPAEEIAKIAVDRHAGLIVVGLHASPILGPRMGSVTYRVLSLSQGLVLALPPA